MGTKIAPAGTDPEAGVSSRDVTFIHDEIHLSARLFIPKLTITPNQKLPLIVYFHGTGFCVSSAFDPNYHNYLNSLVSQANVVAVCVNYRLQESSRTIPAGYEDGWAALKWVAVASHCNGKRQEAWLNDHVDFGRIFLSGETAGTNFVLNLAIAAGGADVGVRLLGGGSGPPLLQGSTTIHG